MASSGALADFGRMSTGRKVFLFAAIAGVLFFFYWRFAYKSLGDNVKKAEAAHTAAKNKNAQLEADIDNFGKLRPKKDELDRQFKEMRRALPTESEIPAFFETIERKLTDAGIDDMKFSMKKEEPYDVFMKVPLQVEITGTYLQIKRFFASLAEKPKKAEPGQPPTERGRIVSIENLSLTQATVRNREIVLTAKFLAVTYRQATPQPAAPTPAGQVPADSPAPTAIGGASNPAPLPTPGTTRQNVEDAMKKDEQRTDSKLKEAEGSARLKGGL